MAGTVEQRTAALLGRLLVERGTTVDELAARLGAAAGDLRRMLAGETGIQLDRLDGVLSALGVSPSEFFARLYGPADPGAAEAGDGAPASAEPPRRSPEDEPITRREVEDLLGELRSTIHGMVRLIDAEREGTTNPPEDPEDS